jgi:hypothetical protein
MSAQQQLETATEERCFLCCPCRDVIDMIVESNELVVRQTPVGKNSTIEAEDTVGIRHQATTGGDIAN